MSRQSKTAAVLRLLRGEGTSTKHCTRARRNPSAASQIGLAKERQNMIANCKRPIVAG